MMEERALWRRLRRHIESGRESAKVDLKLTLDLGPRDKRGEFAKDVTAIANTPGGDGYIVIGVRDAKQRTNQDPNDYDAYIEGFSVADSDAFQRQMVDALSLFCNCVPEIEYHELTHPGCGLPLGVVFIRKSFRRPHRITRESGTIKAEQTWIRRGTASYLASDDDLVVLAREQAELPACLVINLSVRPLTAEQLQEIELQSYIEEVIDLRVQFKPDEPAFEQIEAIVEQLGLSFDEWQQKSIVLELPGLSPAGAAILAYLHGIMGHFPKLLWRRPNPQDNTLYEVRDLISLQAIRDRARDKAAAGEVAVFTP